MRLRRLEDWNAELVNGLSFMSGAVMVFAGVAVSRVDADTGIILLSIGSSMIASAIVVYLSSGYLTRHKQIQDMIETWGLTGIFRTRAAMNPRADVTLARLKSNLDLMGFGLLAFRHAQGQVIEEKVRRGLKVRIITVDPRCAVVARRELDEGGVKDQITQTIRDLGVWVERLKAMSPNPDNIQLKYCDNALVLSYYRQDDYLYTGPYLHGKPSQQTISFEYRHGGAGFEYWSSHFENLWHDASFVKHDVGGP